MIGALALLITAVAGATGMMLGAPKGLMIAIALGGLLAWDLADMNRRQRFAAGDSLCHAADATAVVRRLWR